MRGLIWMVRFSGFTIGFLLASVLVLTALAGCGVQVKKEFGRDLHQGGGTEAGVEFSANSGGTSSVSGWEIRNGKLQRFHREYGRR